jgi:hypothetical protein
VTSARGLILRGDWQVHNGADMATLMSHRAAMRLAWSVWGLTLALWIVSLSLRSVANIGGPAERVIATPPARRTRGEHGNRVAPHRNRPLPR